jgi:hypothetical protein
MAVFLRRSTKFQWLTPAFNELASEIDRYIDWHGDDEPELPYWNNETASVSMLVGAAARRGFIALSDYRTEKTGGRKQGAVKGRCDLYLARGNSWLEIEAKQTYVRLGTSAQSVDAVMGIAIDNAKCIAGKTDRAALVFAVASLSSAQATTDKWISAFTALLEGVKADLCWLWYDPAGGHRYQWGNRIHPAMAIFLKECK